MKLFFALIDKDDVFDPNIHCKETIRIFKCVIAQRETETAVARLLTDSNFLTIQSQNTKGAPQIRYAIIAFQDENTHDGSARDGAAIHVLMRGRLVHIPRKDHDDLLEWELNAEADDAVQQIKELTAHLKTDEKFEAGFYDSVGLADVLESRPEVMCWDKVTGKLTLSHILHGGKKRSITDEILCDSLKTNWGSTPLNRVCVRMEASFDQNCENVINLAPLIAKKFSHGIINTLTTVSLEKSWPRVGDKIGMSKTRKNTGYVVVKSGLKRLQGVSHLPMTTPPLYMSENGKEPRLMTFTRGWYRACLWVHYRYKQPCREQVTFDVVNQSTVAGGNVRHLKFKLHNGNDYLEKPSSSTLFRSSRGLRLLDYAEKVARAHIIGASRQLEVAFCVPFETFWDVDLDTSVDVCHEKLPGGRATGKVIAYQLRITSDSWVVWVKMALALASTVKEADGTENVEDDSDRLDLRIKSEDEKVGGDDRVNVIRLVASTR